MYFFKDLIPPQRGGGVVYTVYIYIFIYIFLLGAGFGIYIYIYTYYIYPQVYRESFLTWMMRMQMVVRTF